MEGFFAETADDRRLIALPTVPQCGACGLYRGCESPKMGVYGKGKLGVLIIGEAPGATEDLRGIPFIGDAGQRLRSTLAKFDVDLKRDCWTTNTLICRPPKNATPTEKQIGYCRPNMTNTIRDLKPNVIIPLGAVAARALLQPIWREDVGGINRWVGWRIPCQEPNAWICPNWHPSYLERSQNPTLDMFFEKYLRAAFKKIKKPTKRPKDEHLKLIRTPDEAVHCINKFFQSETPIAIDYETNMLKPDSREAAIVCCSISDGFYTIAFPWFPQVKEVMTELWVSDIPKTASNLKFEDRWTRSKLGVRPRNWQTCTMQLAHILDNRKGITGLKFQAFVRLGVQAWDDHIAPYLKVKGKRGNVKNQIHKVDMGELLKYCALDSLYEVLVALKQRKELA